MPRVPHRRRLHQGGAVVVNSWPLCRFVPVLLLSLFVWGYLVPLGWRSSSYGGWIILDHLSLVVRLCFLAIGLGAIAWTYYEWVRWLSQMVVSGRAGLRAYMPQAGLTGPWNVNNQPVPAALDLVAWYTPVYEDRASRTTRWLLRHLFDLGHLGVQRGDRVLVLVPNVWRVGRAVTRLNGASVTAATYNRPPDPRPAISASSARMLDA
jgi:hypothetical protein